MERKQVGFNIANYQQVGRRKRKTKKWGKGGKITNAFQKLETLGSTQIKNKKERSKRGQ